MTWAIQFPDDGIIRATLPTRPQAELFAELRGERIMVVTGGGGQPFRRTGRLVSVILQLADEWQLRVKYYGDKGDIAQVKRAFPRAPLILLQGEHKLDFDRLALPPVAHNYAEVWRIVASYCAEIAGSDAVLLDTTETTIRLREAA